MELKKKSEKGTCIATSTLIFSGLLSLLYPFVPQYARALSQVSGLPIGGFSPFPFTKKPLTEVVWAYQLFEAVSLFKVSLGIKKHQKIALFLKADTHSLELFEQHQEILEQLLTIHKLTLLRLHEAEPQGYQQDMFQSMMLGVKLLISGGEKKLSLEELENQYAQQLEYFRYLRTMITDFSAVSGVSDQLEQKKQELEQVK